jgi:hypothetical protein
MSASTTDRATSQREGSVVKLALAANAIIYAGCFVCRDSSGYIVNASDATALTFAGLAEEGYDATDESAGDTEIGIRQDGWHLMAGSGLSRADEGKAVFLLDNQTVATSDHASLVYHIYVGILRKYVSATSGWVEIRPSERNPRLLILTCEVTGPNATTFNFATVAGYFGGSDLYVKRVLAAEAFVTSTGANATVARKVLTTHYTVSGGVVTAVGDESANTWQMTVLAVVEE